MSMDIEPKGFGWTGAVIVAMFSALLDFPFLIPLGRESSFYLFIYFFGEGGISMSVA